MPQELNEKGRDILIRFFDETGTEHTTEEVNKILEETGYSQSRYYQLRLRYLKEHKPVDSEVQDFLEKIRPTAEGGKNANIARLYAQIKGFTEKQEVSNEPTPTDINRIAIKVRDSLRKEWEADGGNCPVCGFNKTLCEEPCLDSEQQQRAGGEVAGVGIPA